MTSTPAASWRACSRDPTPPGSVPQLRLMGALHYLVLSGRAPALAAFYPSARGEEPVYGVWPVAVAAMEEQFDQVRERLHRTVQTNEPGRSAVLFAGLLWLADRHRRPIRLLEVGASAGLNLVADRYSYVVGGRELGDRLGRCGSSTRDDTATDRSRPRQRLPDVAGAGCDLSPLDPTQPMTSSRSSPTLARRAAPDRSHARRPVRRRARARSGRSGAPRSGCSRRWTPVTRMS